MQTEEQRAILDRLTALMSLLEGHADVVMDAVGPQVVPSVEIIRERLRHVETLRDSTDPSRRRGKSDEGEETT